MLSSNKFFISCKESRIENNRSFYSCFYLGPFDSGQSLTIANALRRTLLSELSGIAITSAEIEGASHEYSNIKGVKESVLDILLNLKEIVLKKTSLANTYPKPIHRNSFTSHFDRAAANPTTSDSASVLLNTLKDFNRSNDPLNDTIFVDFGYLKVRGPGVVRARDLKLPPSVHSVDPEQYIATLCEDGTLNIKFSIHEGKNYIIQKTQKSNLQKNMDSSVDYPELKKRSNALKKLDTVAYPEEGSLALGTQPNRPVRARFGGRREEENWKKATNLSMNVANALLPIDAVFMPVSKVNYILESNDQSNDNFTPGSLQRTTYVQNQGNLQQISLQAESETTLAKTDLIEIKRKKLSMFNKHMLNIIKENYASNVYSTSTPYSSTPKGMGKVSLIPKESVNQVLGGSGTPFSNNRALIKSGIWRREACTSDKNLLENFTDSIKNLKKSNLTFKKFPSNLEKTNATSFKLSSKSNVANYGTSNSPLPHQIGYGGAQYPNEKFGRDVSGSNMKALSLSENLNKKNNIILEIWTNGSIHPRQALYEALKNLLGVFLDLQKAQNFKSIFKSPETYQKAYRQLGLKTFKSSTLKTLLSKSALSSWDKTQSRGDARSSKNLLSTPKGMGVRDVLNQKQSKIKKTNTSSSRVVFPAKRMNKQKQNQTNNGINEVIESFDIGSLNISLRAYTCLKRANINTIGELINCTEKQLLEVKNFGKRCFDEVEKSLDSLGLQIKTSH